MKIGAYMVRAHLRAGGWVEDRWGNMRRTGAEGGAWRVKLRPLVVRVEVKRGDMWVLRWSAYYGQIALRDDGTISKLRALSHISDL